MCCTWWKTGCKRRKYLLLLLPVVLILLIVLLTGERGTQRRAMVRLMLWEKAYTRAAEAELAGEPRKVLRSVRSVNVWPCGGERMVDFALGGGGLGSSTRYWGIYTTTDGKPCGWQGTDIPLTPIEESVWVWQEPEGDNAYYTCLLLPDWYYYRMEF